MVTVHGSIEVLRSALSALRQNPATFGQEMRLAAAVKWYEIGLLYLLMLSIILDGLPS